MTSNEPASYEEIRARHFAFMAQLMPLYIARLSWSRNQIEAEQTRALRELIAYAKDRSPWHRDRLKHIDPETLSPQDLSRIPPMNKADLMSHWDEIVTDPRCTLAAAEAHLLSLTTDAYFLGDLHVIASGGSSGTRGVFVFGWEGWAVYWISGMRGLLAGVRATGRAPTGPLASVSAYVASHATSALVQTFSDASRPTVRAPVTLPLADIVETLNASGLSILHSYPSMLPALCEEARHGRLRIEPLVVLSTSEPLLPEVRAAAEATWGVPVLDFWASSEVIATFPCPLGNGMHIGEDICVIEPIDDQGTHVPRGERSSKILVTNLHSQLMPLIRYEITDEFQISEAPCRCGSAYPHVASVEGRSDDIFVYARGVSVHPLNFRSVLGREPAVVEYQVRQTERGADVSLVGRSPVEVEAIRAALEQRLAELGVEAPSVTVRQVDRIERPSTGKLKRFVPTPR